MITVEQIQQGIELAKQASIAKYDQMGRKDAYACGFAWVDIPNGRSPFVNWCKKNNIGDKHWKKGWSIWNPAGNGTQSMDIKEAGAHAFAEVLVKHGITAYMGSRAD